MTRQITVPLRATLDMAERIATGDLTAATTSSRTDELGMLMNAVARMNENLRAMIDEIRIGVSQVSHASGEIAAGNTDLSSRTEQQAAAVEETAASMEQLNATVNRTRITLITPINWPPRPRRPHNRAASWSMM